MKNKLFVFLLIVVIFSIKFISAITVDSEFVTLYSGEEKEINLDVENNHNFDIEDISIQLILDKTPFTSVGSSERSVDDLDEDDDDSVTFKIKASVDIIPGDYNIPYEISYFDVDNTNDKITKEGTFGIRVGAKTEIDYSIDPQGKDIEEPVINQNGQINLEIINKGLGEIKSVSVLILPEGFTLLSKDKVFIGSIDSEDTDTASFEVIYKSPSPLFKAVISYKDFDNVDRTKTLSIPFKVYTEKEALELGIIKKNNVIGYFIVIIVVIIVWFIYRRIKKKKRNNNKKN
jgi:hypothetical protein